uniref:Uncharacterized protein n=1 Tax=Clastoptera arizonana TaxID=38151 RepID=A0A1B6D3I9_9HEMI
MDFVCRIFSFTFVLFGIILGRISSDQNLSRNVNNSILNISKIKRKHVTNILNPNNTDVPQALNKESSIENVNRGDMAVSEEVSEVSEVNDEHKNDTHEINIMNSSTEKNIISIDKLFPKTDAGIPFLHIVFDWLQSLSE